MPASRAAELDDLLRVAGVGQYTRRSSAGDRGRFRADLRLDGDGGRRQPRRPGGRHDGPQWRRAGRAGSPAWDRSRRRCCWRPIPNSAIGARLEGSQQIGRRPAAGAARPCAWNCSTRKRDRRDRRSAGHVRVPGGRAVRARRSGRGSRRWSRSTPGALTRAAIVRAVRRLHLSRSRGGRRRAAARGPARRRTRRRPGLGRPIVMVFVPPSSPLCRVTRLLYQLARSAVALLASALVIEPAAAPRCRPRSGPRCSLSRWPSTYGRTTGGVCGFWRRPRAGPGAARRPRRSGVLRARAVRGRLCGRCMAGAVTPPPARSMPLAIVVVGVAAARSVRCCTLGIAVIVAEAPARSASASRTSRGAVTTGALYAVAAGMRWSFPAVLAASPPVRTPMPLPGRSHPMTERTRLRLVVLQVLVLSLFVTLGGATVVPAGRGRRTGTQQAASENRLRDDAVTRRCAARSSTTRGARSSRNRTAMVVSVSRTELLRQR